jgi:hypothetical protein
MPGKQWNACIHLIPRTETYEADAIVHCPSFFGESSRFDNLQQSFLRTATKFHTPSSGTIAPVVVSLLERAKEDLAALRLYDLDQSDNSWVMAAGLPNYIALFGRDTLTAAWEGGLLGPEMMHGTLVELALWQGAESTTGEMNSRDGWYTSPQQSSCCAQFQTARPILRINYCVRLLSRGSF